LRIIIALLIITASLFGTSPVRADEDWLPGHWEAKTADGKVVGSADFPPPNPDGTFFAKWINENHIAVAANGTVEGASVRLSFIGSGRTTKLVRQGNTLAGTTYERNGAALRDISLSRTSTQIDAAQTSKGCTYEWTIRGFQETVTRHADEGQEDSRLDGGKSRCIGGVMIPE
jgi:hypothetical protein